MEKAIEYSFSRLPDDIVVQVYNKIMDLKTLCYSQLISKRLGSIVFQTDTISFNVPLPIDYENEDRLDDVKMVVSSVVFEPLRYLLKETAAATGSLDSSRIDILGSDSFPSAIKFIKRFTKLKSIRIQFPSYVNVVPDVVNDCVSLFKWKIKFGSRVDSYVIQAKSSEDLLKEQQQQQQEEEEEEEEWIDEEIDEEEKEKESGACFKAYSCFSDVVYRFKKVLDCSEEFPLLEKVYVVDSNERVSVTLNAREIQELRNLLDLDGTRKHKLIHTVELSDTA